MIKVTFYFAVFISVLFVSVSKENQTPDEDRAKVFHYKAIQNIERGKDRSAIKLLKKAIQLDRENQYIIDLANVYARTEKPREAYKWVSVLHDRDINNAYEKVELKAWQGYYTMNLSVSDPALMREAYEIFQMARHMSITYEVDSLELLSIIYNNIAVSGIFYQTPSEGYPVIHMNDYRRAREKLDTAVMYNPANCPAQYNLQVVRKIISEIEEKEDFKKRVVKNVYCQDIASLQFDSMRCKIPRPPLKFDIVKYLNREKEVVFVLDISGSMETKVRPNSDTTRFKLMQKLVSEAINEVDSNILLGLITLGGDCRMEPMRIIPAGSAPREDLLEIVNNLHPAGATPLNTRLRQAINLFTDKKRDKAILLCSDGNNSCGRESTCAVASSIAQTGVKVHAFSLLLDREENDQVNAIYDCIAKATKGQFIVPEPDSSYQSNIMFIAQEVLPLVLTQEDLLRGSFTSLVPRDSIFRYVPESSEISCGN